MPVKDGGKKMGERCCGESVSATQVLPALQYMGPMSGMFIQDEIEFGLLSSDVSALAFGQ